MSFGLPRRIRHVQYVYKLKPFFVVENYEKELVQWTSTKHDVEDITTLSVINDDTSRSKVQVWLRFSQGIEQSQVVGYGYEISPDMADSLRSYEVFFDEADGLSERQLFVDRMTEVEGARRGVLVERRDVKDRKIVRRRVLFESEDYTMGQVYKSYERGRKQRRLDLSETSVEDGDDVHQITR
ncbi:predicted protein [Uncinocarpus reesii 1704]|uniref:Uncharacterized protein n=1 Tax=Uncinocarpus reesii (strain UAMH 1704) TaxID=336963 RepID=C4JLK7_UNCRE|nr:uncharacterized protein UREG_03715 [Uncinocarpus reesii 1704]EEP78869.1 predicted protein [Uncinocarpus reesii 1704]